MRSIWSIVVFVALLTAMAGSMGAEMLLDVSRDPGPEPESKVEKFAFEVANAEVKPTIKISARLDRGRVRFRVLDPAGAAIRDDGWSKRLTVAGAVLKTSGKIGRFELEVGTDAAVGTWHVSVFELPGRSAFWVFLIPGPAMILVALASVIYWKRRSKAKLKWFWMGAGIWAVGVAIKFAWALLLNAAVLGALREGLSRQAYVLASAGYLGLQSAICEIGITLAAVVIWREMTRNANRAIAVGVGAGAFEAALLGLLSFVIIIGGLLRTPGSESIRAATAASTLATPLAWLAAPVERIIAILCHTSSRALVLLSVAQGRRSLFWWGLIIFAGLDGVAGLFHVLGLVGESSSWWIELAVAPFAVVSIPVIRWCMRHWPTDTTPSDGPMR